MSSEKQGLLMGRNRCFTYKPFVPAVDIFVAGLDSNAAMHAHSERLAQPRQVASQALLRPVSLEAKDQKHPYASAAASQAPLVHRLVGDDLVP